MSEWFAGFLACAGLGACLWISVIWLKFRKRKAKSFSRGVGLSA